MDFAPQRGAIRRAKGRGYGGPTGHKRLRHRNQGAVPVAESWRPVGAVKWGGIRDSRNSRRLENQRYMGFGLRREWGARFKVWRSAGASVLP